jgi:arginase
MMDIEIIQIPYDSGHFCKRTGCGPDYFIKNGIIKVLQDDGHKANIHRIEAKATFNTEVGTTFELNRTLAETIKSLPKHCFPLVFSGNCNSCVGPISGLGLDKIGIIWFDAHGDYNTPDTTISGFLDGMGLAMATGQCWKTLLQQISGYKPVPEKNVIHVGSLDLDSAEQRMFEKAGIPVITDRQKDENTFITDFNEALDNLCRDIKNVYVHIDMDVLEMGQAKANHLALPGGLNVETVADCLRMIKEKFKISACGIASADPLFDKREIMLNAGIRIIKTILE